MADLPNHHQRCVKFLEGQQNGADARIANAKEHQVGEELLWEIQCFGKYQLQVLSRDVKFLECQQNEAGAHIEKEHQVGKELLWEIQASAHSLRTWEVQCFGKHRLSQESVKSFWNVNRQGQPHVL